MRSQRITKRQAVDSFKEHLLPLIPADDKPAKRLAWNNYVDGLERDGQITEKQAATWDQPACVKR